MKKRCEWPTGHDIMIAYHDNEWGVPLHDDTKLFEFMIMDAFQAGLSWLTIMKKRENFRQAFDNYDVQKIAAYGQDKIDMLLQDEGIIRNKAKINATINNAKVFLETQKEFGTFNKYIWSFVNHKPVNNGFKSLDELPANTELSDLMSKDLKKRGFKFVGTTICYAFMQAAGLVNDHIRDCYRYEEIIGMQGE